MLQISKIDKQFKRGFISVVSIIESLGLLLFATLFICAIICVLPYLFGGDIIVKLLSAYLISTTILQHTIFDLFNFDINLTIYISLAIIGVIAILFIIFAIKDYMKYRPGSVLGKLFKILIFILLAMLFFVSGAESIVNMYPIKNYAFLCFLFGGIALVMVVLDFIAIVVDKKYCRKLKLNASRLTCF